jgi:ABC-type antimicrobial peptide transport system permease subunit
MIKNYFKIAVRNILRHKAYSALNIAGLAIGMACSILILLWVQDEKSYDRFNTDAADIYRMTPSVGDFKAAITPAGMGEGLQYEMTGIKRAVRISKPDTRLFITGDKKFEEKNSFYVDSNFFQLFSYKLLKGNMSTALLQPDAVLLTEDIAKKYFGNEDAVGKILKTDNNGTCIVTGVLENAPSNSHLQFDVILPMSAIANNNDIKRKTWGNFNFYSYFLMDKSRTSSPAAVANTEAEIKKIFKTHNSELNADFHLSPLTSIHLQSDLQIDLPGKGNKQYVSIFFIVAIFIIAVACINFMNLATARSQRRAKEVGLRKVVGADRKQLIFQFLSESTVIAFLSLLIAIGIVYLTLPLFNQLAEKQLSIHLFDRNLIFTLLGIAFFTGIVAGSYPALYLSGFKPIKTLKGKFNMGNSSVLFRNGLVVTQFVVTIILITGTVVVFKQLHFIKNKNLGFDKANLLYVPMKGEIWGKQQALKDALRQNSLTSNFSVISDLPTALESGTIDVVWEGIGKKNQVVFPSLAVDENFTSTFRTTILAGRSFSREYKGDSSNYVINEKAMHLMGMNLDNAVGKSLSFGDVKGVIIGVVKDFNFKSLQYEIDPLVIQPNRYGGIVMFRTEPGKTEATIKALENIYKGIGPSYPFTFNFLDQELDNLYKSEKQVGRIFNLFALLAVFISCLGLYGLSAFMAEQRTKEIGVRKVLGASVANIVYLLSTKFTKLVIVAIIIAVPLAWFAINNWLKGFAYHIDVSWGIFVAASLLVLLIAWFTVSYESIKAAITNPVKSLKTE